MSDLSPPVCHSFGAFYARRFREMVRFATPLCEGRGTAEDLVQQAFTQALINWRLVGSLEEGPRIIWIRTTMVRLNFAEGRRRMLWRKTAPRLYQPDLSRAPDPEDAALAAVSAAACRTALAEMSHLERSVAVLCWVLGFSGAEAAEILGLNNATVRSAKKRARDKLLGGVGADAIAYWSEASGAREGGLA